jgi:GTP-binding protein
VIDASEGDPTERFAQIDRELRAYGAGLDERPQVVVLNKIDLLASSPPFDLDDERIVGVFEVSAATGAGIDRLRRSLFELVPQVVEAEMPEGLPDFLVYRPQPDPRRAFRIFRTDRGFRVVGRVPAEEELERALRDAGAKRGDEVEVAGEALEFQ